MPVIGGGFWILSDFRELCFSGPCRPCFSYGFINNYLWISQKERLLKRNINLEAKKWLNRQIYKIHFIDFLFNQHIRVNQKGRKIKKYTNNRLYKLERILMQQVDLKSASNFKDFL